MKLTRREAIVATVAGAAAGAVLKPEEFSDYAQFGQVPFEEVMFGWKDGIFHGKAGDWILNEMTGEWNRITEVKKHNAAVERAFLGGGQ